MKLKGQCPVCGAIASVQVVDMRSTEDELVKSCWCGLCGADFEDHYAIVYKGYEKTTTVKNAKLYILSDEIGADL